MEKEIDIQDVEDKEDEEESVSRETPRRSIDSTARPRRSVDSTVSSSKKRKEDHNKLKDKLSSDPFMNVFADVQGDLENDSQHVGAMAASMQRQAEIQEKAMAKEDPLQKLQNEAILELQKLGLSGTEVVNAAAVFVKVPAQMSMLLALPESLRREYVLKMLIDEEKKEETEEGCQSWRCLLFVDEEEKLMRHPIFQLWDAWCPIFTLEYSEAT